MDILFGIILFFVLLYYGFKIFLRYGLPWLIAHFFRRQQKKYSSQTQNPGYKSRPEGDVRVKAKPSKKPKNDDGFGEYVDFEDVDDK